MSGGDDGSDSNGMVMVMSGGDDGSYCSDMVMAVFVMV